MKVYEQIKDMLCEELEEIAKKNDLTPTSLEILDTAVDVLKDLKTIEAMDGEYGYSGDDGYSGYFRRYPYYMYDDGGMSREGGYSREGGSYARGGRGGGGGGGSSRGRYAYGGYSGDAKEELKKIMHQVQDERDREAIRKVIESMDR